MYDSLIIQHIMKNGIPNAIAYAGVAKNPKGQTARPKKIEDQSLFNL